MVSGQNLNPPTLDWSFAGFSQVVAGGLLGLYGSLGVQGLGLVGLRYCWRKVGFGVESFLPFALGSSGLGFLESRVPPRFVLLNPKFPEFRTLLFPNRVLPSAGASPASAGYGGSRAACGGG